MKHIALLHILRHLKKKEAGFFALDTHAGRGCYDLTAHQAEKTGEADAGIAALWSNKDEIFPEPLHAYLALLRELNGGETLKYYPGSPRLIRMMLRPQDRAVFFEKHPQDFADLQMNEEGKRARTLHGDGWQALKSHLPPRERRGIVMVDPPYEQKEDFYNLTTQLGEALNRFATGIYLLWYPIKGLDARDRLEKQVRALKTSALRLELWRQTPNHPKRLDGSGLIVINPPWQFAEDMQAVLNVLAPLFATGKGACEHVDCLVGD